MRDNMNEIGRVSVDIPAVKTATVTGTTIDLLGAEAALVMIHFGNSGDTLSGSVYWTPKLQESPDDSTWNDVAAGDLINTELAVIDAPAEDSTIQSVGYKGEDRYIRAVITATGTHTNGTPIGITALLSHKRRQP